MLFTTKQLKKALSSSLFSRLEGEDSSVEKTPTDYTKEELQQLLEEVERSIQQTGKKEKESYLRNMKIEQIEDRYFSIESYGKKQVIIFSKDKKSITIWSPGKAKLEVKTKEGESFEDFSKRVFRIANIINYSYYLSNKESGFSNFEADGDELQINRNYAPDTTVLKNVSSYGITAEELREYLEKDDIGEVELGIGKTSEEYGATQETPRNLIQNFMGVSIPEKEYKILSQMISQNGAIDLENYNEIKDSFPKLKENIDKVIPYLPKLYLLKEIREIVATCVLNQISEEWGLWGARKGVLGDNQKQAEEILSEMSKEMDIYAFIQNPESIPEYIAKTIEYVKKLHNIKTFDSVDNFDEIISTFNNANNDNIEKNRLKILDLFRVGWVTKGNSEVVKTDLQKDLLKEQEFAKIREFLSSPENFGDDPNTVSPELLKEKLGISINVAKGILSEYQKQVNKRINNKYKEELRQQIRAKNPEADEVEVQEILKLLLKKSENDIFYNTVQSVGIDLQIREMYKNDKYSKNEYIQMYGKIVGVEWWRPSDSFADFGGDLIPDLIMALIPIGTGLAGARLLMNSAKSAISATTKIERVNAMNKIVQANKLGRVATGTAEFAGEVVIGGYGFHIGNSMMNDFLFNDSFDKDRLLGHLSDGEEIGRSMMIFAIMGGAGRIFNRLGTTELGKYFNTKINALPKNPKFIADSTKRLTQAFIDGGLMVEGDSLYTKWFTDKEVQDLTLQEFIQASAMALIFRKFLKPKELKDMKPEEIAKLDLANTNPKRINDLLRESGLEELTPEQLKIVKDLHNDVSKGFGENEFLDILKMVRILREGGIKKEQTKVLMEKGIVGKVIEMLDTKAVAREIISLEEGNVIEIGKTKIERTKNGAEITTTLEKKNIPTNTIPDGTYEFFDVDGKISTYNVPTDTIPDGTHNQLNKDGSVSTYNVTPTKTTITKRNSTTVRFNRYSNNIDKLSDEIKKIPEDNLTEFVSKLSYVERIVYGEKISILKDRAETLKKRRNRKVELLGKSKTNLAKLEVEQRLDKEIGDLKVGESKRILNTKVTRKGADLYTINGSNKSLDQVKSYFINNFSTDLEAKFFRIELKINNEAENTSNDLFVRQNGERILSERNTPLTKAEIATATATEIISGDITLGKDKIKVSIKDGELGIQVKNGRRQMNKADNLNSEISFDSGGYKIEISRNREIKMTSKNGLTATELKDMLEENSTLKNSFDEQLLVEETINNFYNWYDYLLLETNKIPDQKVRNFLKKIPDIIRGPLLRGNKIRETWKYSNDPTLNRVGKTIDDAFLLGAVQGKKIVAPLIIIGAIIAEGIQDGFNWEMLITPMFIEFMFGKDIYDIRKNIFSPDLPNDEIIRNNEGDKVKNIELNGIPDIE